MRNVNIQRIAKQTVEGYVFQPNLPPHIVSRTVVKNVGVDVDGKWWTWTSYSDTDTKGYTRMHDKGDFTPTSAPVTS